MVDDGMWQAFKLPIIIHVVRVYDQNCSYMYTHCDNPLTCLKNAPNFNFHLCLLSLRDPVQNFLHRWMRISIDMENHIGNHFLSRLGRRA